MVEHCRRMVDPHSAISTTTGDFPVVQNGAWIIGQRLHHLPAMGGVCKTFASPSICTTSLLRVVCAVRISSENHIYNQRSGRLFAKNTQWWSLAHKQWYGPTRPRATTTPVPARPRKISTAGAKNKPAIWVFLKENKQKYDLISIPFFSNLSQF